MFGRTKAASYSVVQESVKTFRIAWIELEIADLRPALPHAELKVSFENSKAYLSLSLPHLTINTGREVYKAV
jgi:hypothetical protein